jgi:hypothetical protein
MNPVLMEAIIYMARFLELSDENTINPEAAAEQIENLGDILDKLSPDERSQFIAFLEKYAHEEQRRGGNEEFVAFLLFFAEDFGWTT